MIGPAVPGRYFHHSVTFVLFMTVLNASMSAAYDEPLHERRALLRHTANASYHVQYTNQRPTVSRAYARICNRTNRRLTACDDPPERMRRYLDLEKPIAKRVRLH
jgi:hypothetical protein